ncbi:MAG: NUDIX hydrolase [Ornithinimicrobium sp.]|uniref:NUDIX hydrolase n=1 Tax=Ornithinimicrobium sp. TaxID=1977084 RepID=UPI0026DF5EF2|nr:NUDIX hydrolase [Ornithinimicrobium sp.]MDO5739906.1 NUDIX hydrolase [Ornithinimicrobium sp.]
MTSDEVPELAHLAEGASWVEVAPGVAALTGLAHLPSEEAAAIEVVAALVDAALADGHRRVEAEIDADDTPTRRVLQRCALRPEGTGRARRLDEHGIPADTRVFARLADDPPPGTRPAFLAMLDATLPLKRLIVQGLVRDGQGRLLLCELTYKKDWDLVGGVADPAESPVESLAREVREEWGIELPVGDLVAVNWLPPYRQWRDALLLVFDLGTHPDLAERVVLQRSELAAVHWVTLAEAADRVAPYVQRLLHTLREHEVSGSTETIFCQDGVLRGVLP